MVSQKQQLIDFGELGMANDTIYCHIVQLQKVTGGFEDRYFNGKLNLRLKPDYNIGKKQESKSRNNQFQKYFSETFFKKKSH